MEAMNKNNSQFLILNSYFIRTFAADFWFANSVIGD